MHGSHFCILRDVVSARTILQEAVDDFDSVDLGLILLALSVVTTEAGYHQRREMVLVELVEQFVLHRGQILIDPAHQLFNDQVMAVVCRQV